MAAVTEQKNTKNTHLDDDDALLDYVVDLGLDELEEHIDALLSGALNADRTTADSAYSLSVDQVWIRR